MFRNQLGAQRYSEKYDWDNEDYNGGEKDGDNKAVISPSIYNFRQVSSKQGKRNMNYKEKLTSIGKWTKKKGMTNRSEA